MMMRAWCARSPHHNSAKHIDCGSTDAAADLQSRAAMLPQWGAEGARRACDCNSCSCSAVLPTFCRICWNARMISSCDIARQRQGSCRHLRAVPFAGESWRSVALPRSKGLLGAGPEAAGGQIYHKV